MPVQIIRQLGLKEARNSFDGLRGDLFNSKFRMEGMAFALINKKIIIRAFLNPLIYTQNCSVSALFWPFFKKHKYFNNRKIFLE